MARKKNTTKLDLDPTLAPRIQAALERGLTVAMTCAECGIGQDTFYRYMKSNQDFQEAVTRAQQTAHIKAVEVFRSGLESQKENHVEINEFSETRLDRKTNKPYTYVKKTTTKKVIEHPADPRIAVEWLKRRDSQNWSEKLYLEFELDISKIYEWARLLQDFKQSPADVMEKMLQRLHAEKSKVSHDA
jgi:hypothetical protein